MTPNNWPRKRIKKHLLKTILLIATLLAWEGTKAQTIPKKIIDSLIFEAIRGRACGIALKASQIEINTAEREIIANGKAITLLNDQVAQASFMWDQYEFLYKTEIEKRDATEARLKTQRKGLIKWIIAEGAIIVLLVIILI